VLAGRLATDQGIHRVFINTCQNAHAPPEGMFDVRRNFNPAIGITQDLPFTAALFIYPMPLFEDTLKKDNHLCGEIPGCLVSY
jgi:hypothetical protein